MNPLSKFNHIPWKYIVGMNLSVLALAVTFTTLKPATTSTEDRSQAQEVPPVTTSPTPLVKPYFDPQNLPEIDGPDLSWAKIDDAIVIKGKNLGNIPFGILKIGSIIVPQSNIIDWEPTQIVFTVPENSITATITLTYTDSTEKTTTLTTKNPLTITDKNL